MLSARTINLDGPRASWVRKVAMYTLAKAGAKMAKKLGRSKVGRLSMRGRVRARPLLFSLTEFPKQPTIRSQKSNMEVAPMTERVRMSFRLKEFPGGQPWICLEPIKEDLIVLANGFLGFDLPAGTTIEKAKKIAEFLEENVATVSYTKLY
jgi:hypothetical protein